MGSTSSEEFRVPLTRGELEEHLRRKTRHLRASARVFDEEDRSEAERMATTLRVLLHDTRQSHALLSSLGLLKSLQFVDSAPQTDPGAVVTSVAARLSPIMASGPGGPPPSFEPWCLVPGAEQLPTRTIGFRDWWKRDKIIHTARNDFFSREELVLALANQDGGAHVDPALDRKYSRLSRLLGLGIQVTYEGEPFPMENPAWASVRQIAWEVVATLENDPRSRQILGID